MTSVDIEEFRTLMKKECGSEMDEQEAWNRAIIDRPHQGLKMNGRTSYQTFLDGIAIEESEEVKTQEATAAPEAA